MRRGSCRVVPVALAIALALPGARAYAAATTQPLGWHPLSSRAAAALVQRSPFEPRPANRRTNHTVPSKRLLLAWRKRNSMPYRGFVNGRFKGRTDEIIQWAAYKWGLDENVLRAAALQESWWRQSSFGDGGDSFGLFRVRRPFHCRGKCAIARRSTAFNADYYAGTIRAYYDGMMTWLNTVERGAEYRAGDLWGSLGAWFAGRWWTHPASGYVAQVRGRLAERTWEQGFFAGP
jgi:hypothetical protein